VCGVCEVAQSVRRPSSPTTAAAERGSSGAATSRWLPSTPETTRSQPSNSPSSSSSAPLRFATFEPRSGNSSTSSFTASSTERTAGSWVVVDQHELRRVEPGRAILGDDDRDDVACEPDDVPRHERPFHPRGDVPVRRRAERVRVDVRADEDLDVRELLGSRRVDRGYARMRERRADKGDGEGSLEVEVLDVPALPAEKPRIFDPQDAVAQDAHDGATLTPPEGGDNAPARTPRRVRTAAVTSVRSGT
jgi:hypothetical protein